MEVTASILSSHSHFHTSLPSLTFSKFSLSPKPSSSFIHLCISNSALPFPLKFPLYPSNPQPIKPTFKVLSAVEEVALEEIPDETQEKVQKRKLFVVNLPYSISSDDLKNVFGQCGTVKDVELIRDKGGKNRGYAFVTMASGEEAQAVIDKFHSTEMSGRTIRVEYSRRLKKPRPQPEPSTDLPAKEALHKLYVSNLQWKVRSIHLRDFFSTNFNPIAVRVVFESSPSGRSAGYGFVSFNTREEAESAISSLNGKELLGRPVHLKFSEQNSKNEATNEEGEKDKLDEEEEKEKDKSDESTGVLDDKEVSVTEPEES